MKFLKITIADKYEIIYIMWLMSMAGQKKSNYNIIIEFLLF